MAADFIGLFGWYLLLSKPGFTAEPQRSLREISSAPIGRRRLEQKLRPFGNKIDPFMAMEPIVSLLIIEQKPFCLSASPDKQKILSLRPRRLCGENVILDKHDILRLNKSEVKR
jgi:hypothetical protein